MLTYNLKKTNKATYAKVVNKLTCFLIIWNKIVLPQCCHGIYFSWPKYKIQLKGFSGIEFKSFKMFEEVDYYLGIRILNLMVL